MKNRWLPALTLTPSLVLVGACVYGFIAFTIYLSFTTSTLMPQFELAEEIPYHRLFRLSTFALSAKNLGVFSVLYIGLSLLLGMLMAILIDQKVAAKPPSALFFSTPWRCPLS